MNNDPYEELVCFAEIDDERTIGVTTQNEIIMVVKLKGDEYVEILLADGRQELNQISDLLTSLKEHLTDTTALLLH